MAIENAAPELRTSVHVTVSPMIGTGWPGVSSLTASTFVTISSISTTAATDNNSDCRRRGVCGEACGVRGRIGLGHRIRRSCRLVSHSHIIH